MIGQDTFDRAGTDHGPRVTGVMVGIVLKDRDPDDAGRVKVWFPGLTDDKTGHWARVVALMAGPERGTYFRPEENDQVIVAFECGDFGRPYVLGGLWSRADKPPDTNADGKNNVRLIKSRSGHLLRFDDTKDAEKIEILDKSGESWIVIDSKAGSVTIRAAKDLVIEAKDGALTLKGKSVSIASTDGAVAVEAKKDAKLVATGGNLDLKGTKVNINC
jgi:uncharacterized protein involved in type VI secretion and phage assembly